MTLFRITPPMLHQMILKLEEKGHISRTPGQAGSIQLLVDPDEILRLLPLKVKQVGRQNQPVDPTGSHTPSS